MAILIGNRAKGTTFGQVRYATDQEAQDGAVVEAAIKPYQLQQAIEEGVGSIIGPLQYIGLFDPTIGTPDLRGAKKGYFYKVSKTGTYLGIEMTQGDNMYLRGDMPENNVDPSLIDVIDNTESISLINDLHDVNIDTPADRQALVYVQGEWVNQDMVYVLPDLEDVEIRDHFLSASYTSSTGSSSLTNKRDHVVDTLTQTTKVMTLPSNLDPVLNKIKISNIGAGEVEVRVPTGVYFQGLVTTPYTLAPSKELILHGYISTQTLNGVTTEYKTWRVESLANLGERQVLATPDDGLIWGNYFLNASQVLGVARQGEIDRTQTGAGLNADGSFPDHAGRNYINGATSLRSTDIILDTALKAEETSRISADNTLQANLNSEASSRISADNTLQGNINTLQAEVDLIEQSVGINADGSITAFTASNFLNGVTNLKEMSEVLDGEVKRIETLTVSGVLDLQSELDNTQDALGGMTTAGTFTSFNGSNYLDLATSFRNADELLDTALKAEETARIDAVQAEENARVADVARIDALDVVQNSRLDALEAIDPDHQAELDLIEQSVGLEADGGITAFTDSNFLNGISTIKGMVAQLDEEAKRIEQLNLTGILDMQEELDATQNSLGGMDSEGVFTAFNGSNYLDTASTFRNADELLDTALKAEETARINDVARVDGVLVNHDDRLVTLEGTANDLQDELDATQLGAGLNGDGSYTPPATAPIQTAVGVTTISQGLQIIDANVFANIARVDTLEDKVDTGLMTQSIYVIESDADLQTAVDDYSLNGYLWHFNNGTREIIGNTLELTDLVNFKMQSISGATGAAGVVELKNMAITISGLTSIRNIIRGFQVEGLVTIDGTLGAHRFIDSQLLGGLTLQAMQGFIIFKDCEIEGDVLFDATFAGVAYFIDCNFDGINSFTNNALPQQVIITQCSGFPLASVASVTPFGTMSFDDLSVRNFNTHLSLPNALSFTGKTSELTADSLDLPDSLVPFTGKTSQLLADSLALPNSSPFTGKTSELTADSLDLPDTLSPFTGFLSQINDDIGYVTANSAPVRSVNTLQGEVVLNGDNILSDYAPTSYTITTGSLDDHFAQIDSTLGEKANSADLADVAISGTASDVAVVANPANYTPLNPNVEAHLVALDDALASAGAVKEVNSVAPNTLGNVIISSNNISCPSSFSAGYVVPADSSLTDHFTAIDLAISLAGKVETVNGESPDVDKNVLITGEHIDHASTITAWTPTDGTIKGALTGLSDKLALLDDVAYSGDYADLSNVPTAVINQGILITSTIDPIALLPGRHYIVAISEADTLIANLPSSITGYERNDGDYIRITNWGNGTIKLREVDNESFILDGQRILDGQLGVAELTINSRGTIHVYGFDYTPLFPQAWGVYYTSSVEFNTKGAQDGSIFKFNTATQKMELSEALSDVAYSGSADDIDPVYVPTEYTPSTLSVSGHLEGIDDRLGSLKLAVNIQENLVVNNFTPTDTNVEGYFEGIDNKLAGVATAQGAENSLQVGNGSGGLVDRDWTMGADDHLIPNVDSAYDVGSSALKVRSLYIDSVKLGANDTELLMDGPVLKIGGKTLKAEGAPLYDGASLRQLVNGGTLTLVANNSYLAYDNGSVTWTLPPAGVVASGVVIDIIFRGDSEGQITLAVPNPLTESISAEGQLVTSKVIKGRGNQVRLAFDGSLWVLSESKMTAVRGTIQYFAQETANTTLKLGYDHRSISDNDLIFTLPAISTTLDGDCVQVSRGINLGSVTINPDVADAGANAILTQSGYQSNFTLARGGDNVKFISDGTKWVTQEERAERVAEVFTSSPAFISKANTFAVIENAQASCVVTLPPSNQFLDGDFVEIYAVEEKEITLTLDAFDSGTRFIFTGSTQNNSVVRTLPQGATLRVKWEATNDRFFLESSVGTAGYLNAGTGAGEVVVLDGNAKLPAIDGSQLTGIVTGTGRLGFIKLTASATATKLYHHSVDTTASSIVVTLPLLSSVDEGDFLRVKLTTKGGSNVLSIQSSGADTLEKSANALIVDVEGDFVELIANKTDGNWEIVG